MKDYYKMIYVMKSFFSIIIIIFILLVLSVVLSSENQIHQLNEFCNENVNNFDNVKINDDNGILCFYFDDDEYLVSKKFSPREFRLWMEVK